MKLENTVYDLVDEEDKKSSFCCPGVHRETRRLPPFQGSDCFTSCLMNI